MIEGIFPNKGLTDVGASRNIVYLGSGRFVSEVFALQQYPLNPKPNSIPW